jgi:hypothetical protein
MTPLSYFSFAWRILVRDRLYTLTYGIMGTILSTFFFLSVRIHIHLYGGLSLSSIVSFDQTPQILFYVSLLSLMSLGLFHSIQRLGDIGVMMAVGGNRLGCIWLHSLVLLLLFLPVALLGFVLGKFLTPPTAWDLARETQTFFIGLSFVVLICFSVSFPTVGLTTFIDPYRAIRRQR